MLILSKIYAVKTRHPRNIEPAKLIHFQLLSEPEMAKQEQNYWVTFVIH